MIVHTFLAIRNKTVESPLNISSITIIVLIGASLHCTTLSETKLNASDECLK